NTNRDEPPQVLQLPDFYIDRAEVTNAGYQRCVAADKCQPPIEQRSYSHPSYYTDTRFASYPVIYVSWQQAQSYCAWAGKRLPSEAEWEKAAGWNSAMHAKA